MVSRGTLLGSELQAGSLLVRVRGFRAARASVPGVLPGGSVRTGGSALPAYQPNTTRRSQLSRPGSAQDKCGNVMVILYKRVFRFHAKNWVRKQVRAEKTRACFSSAKNNRKEPRKDRVPFDPCRFPLTREKRERKKQVEVFKDALVAKDTYLLHHDAQDRHAPKY